MGSRTACVVVGGIWKETEILLNRPDSLYWYLKPFTGCLHLSRMKLQFATDFVLSMGFLRIAPVPTGC
jgi:hypothetical protein